MASLCKHKLQKSWRFVALRNFYDQNREKSSSPGFGFEYLEDLKFNFTVVSQGSECALVGFYSDGILKKKDFEFRWWIERKGRKIYESKVVNQRFFLYHNYRSFDVRCTIVYKPICPFCIPFLRELGLLPAEDDDSEEMDDCEPRPRVIPDAVFDEFIHYHPILEEKENEDPDEIEYNP
ncbi:hypothetical protein M3Y95_01032100 [Aphelenchoides besseyi]|nr:hypothetical protein M3Y95_01032100 [Aphelenchoides besseyi]